jgi:hypothetical protein
VHVGLAEKAILYCSILTCSGDENIEERTTRNLPSSSTSQGNVKTIPVAASAGVDGESMDRKTSFILFCGTLCVLGVLSVLTGCAKVGDPLPPIVNIPDPVRDLQLIQVGSETVELVFAVADDAVREVEVYRECGKEVSNESQPFARFEVADLGVGIEEGTRVFLDSINDVTGRCNYAVRLRGSSRHWSDRSDSVSIVDATVAQAPTNLRAKVMEDRIELTWDPPQQNVDGTEPASLIGYLVNSRHRSSEARHLDWEFEFGESVTYVVQSVSREGNPLVLSLPSAALTVEPKDVFPPEAPAKLMAVAVGDAVQLIWDANTEADLAGYAVYRRLAGGNFESIATLVTVNRFLDETASSGTPLQYAVSALDNAENESPYSEVTDIVVNP